MDGIRQSNAGGEGEAAGMKLIRDDWSIMLIHKISREWEWTLIPMGIGSRKKIEGSRAFPTREEARADALQLAANCGLKIYSPERNR